MDIYNRNWLFEDYPAMEKKIKFKISLWKESKNIVNNCMFKLRKNNRTNY